MWPIAILLMAVVLFYWLAFCLTVAAWLKAIVHLLGGHFIRAALWFSIGCGMLFWWFNEDIDFDTWTWICCDCRNGRTWDICSLL